MCNFINSIFPFTFISLGVGVAFLLISPLFDKNIYYVQFSKIFSRIGNILYAIGIIFLVSTLPVRLGFIPLIIIGVILLLLIGIKINIALTDTESKYDVYIIQNIILIVSTIVFSIVLYPDYKINTTVQENAPIGEETRILTSFNDITLASVSGEMHMALTFGKGKISTSEYVTYWYVDEHGDVLYDKSLAYDSVKKV